MTLQFKEKLKIPVLYDEKTYRAWSEGINRSLGSLKLKHYRNFEVKEPTVLLEAEVANLKNCHRTFLANARREISYLKRIPLEFIKKVNEKCLSVEMKLFDKA